MLLSSNPSGGDVKFEHPDKSNVIKEVNFPNACCSSVKF